MIAIRGGTILTVGAGVIENGVILIEGTTIQSVGHNLEIPKMARVIDANGYFITPGFIDAHCHVGLAEEIYQVEGDDVNEISEPVTPFLRALDGVNPRDLAFGDAIEAGITRLMVHPGSANVIGGQSTLLCSWSPTVDDMVFKNSWGIKAALGENPKRVYGKQNKMPRTRMASAALLREALSLAAESEGKPASASNESYRRQPLLPVIKGEVPLWVHAHRADDILTALRIKDEFGIKLVLQHGTEAHLVAEEIASRKVPVCLGPLLVNRAKVEMQAVSFANARLLYEAGVDFCLITDHPVIPIQYLGLCAALAVKAGLPEMVALEALTLAPARILGVDNELGSIIPGKRADLVIFNGSPLDLPTRVRTVMVDGMIWGE